MKTPGNKSNGRKRKENMLAWVSEMFSPTVVPPKEESKTSDRKLLMASPVTRDEADKIVDFFHNKMGDILLFLNDTADPKLMMAMRFYFEHKHRTEGSGWMVEIVPDRAYLIFSERPKVFQLSPCEEGVKIREVSRPANGSLESHHPGDYPGDH